MRGLFDLANGITAGILRLGIAQGGVEVADSRSGFQFWIGRDGVRISGGHAPDILTAKQKARLSKNCGSSARLRASDAG